MFIHRVRLPHVLRPRLYSCPQHYALEQSRLFAPIWHLVGSLADVATNGDFITRDLLGTPIIVRNCDGQIQTFLNVCPHRHCMLIHEDHGHQTTLTCQYHAWEFMSDGRTARIPDAQNFKPLPGGPECLRKFPTEVRGPLIFVSLLQSPLPIDQQLGPLTQVCEEFPSERWAQCERWSYEFNANWKIVVENTVETYHVQSVHPKTLVHFGPDDDVEHVISERASIMRANIFLPTEYRRIADWVLPSLEPGCQHRYNLYHGFPNMLLIRIDAMLQVMIVNPLSPETCRLTVYVFVLKAVKETALSQRITTDWGVMKCKAIKEILAEDGKLYPDLHRGMKHSPFHGTISIREELVYAFQDYVYRHCGLKYTVETLTE